MNNGVIESWSGSNTGRRQGWEVGTGELHHCSSHPPPQFSFPNMHQPLVSCRRQLCRLLLTLGGGKVGKLEPEGIEFEFARWLLP
jgi:hypothetical protein